MFEIFSQIPLIVMTWKYFGKIHGPSVSMEIGDDWAPSHSWTYSVLGDQDVSCYVEDQVVQLTGVEGQGVVVVEAVDLDVLQAHLVVWKDGVGVDRVVGNDWEHI